eukprot:GHVS01053489.1.p1 GENE.GHVS01053489.1~~GHVS01053489.1.p1  ORF type:complete len:622 (+),score=73.36 GHVS01053489.1:490-2355(+)
MMGSKTLLFVCVFVVLAVPALCGAGMGGPSKIEIEPTLICQKGYVKEGKDCVKTVYEEPIVTCPPGFEPSSTSSSSRYSSGYMRSSSSENNSDSNYKRTSRQYQKKKLKNRDEKTPDECIRIITVPPRPYCPPGFETTNSFGGEQACVKYTQESPEPYCGRGYTMRGDSCFRSSVHDPSFTCIDPEFTMVGRQCQRLLEMKPMEGCPEGHMLDGNSCVKVERQAPFDVCPQGSIPLNGACVTRTVKPAEKTCPRGFTMEGENCLKADVIKSVKCEEDAQWDGSECMQEKILEAAQKCDDGWTLEADGFCTKVLKKRPTKFCEDGQLNPRTQQCEKMEAILPDFTCPPGYENNDDNDCVKLTVEPVEYKCTPRFELKNKQCVLEESTPPDQQCPDSFLLIDDSCMRPSYRPKWRKCQNGFNLVADHCTAVQEMAPEMICPTGFDLKVNQCVEERRLDAQLRCSSPDVELRGGRCIGTISRPSKEECEKPYVYNKKTRMCEDKEVVEPDIECPAGYENKGECLRTERTQPVPRCPDDHYYDQYYNNCVANKRYVPSKTVHTAPAPQHQHKTSSYTPVITTSTKKGGSGHSSTSPSSFYYGSGSSGHEHTTHGGGGHSSGGYAW